MEFFNDLGKKFSRAVRSVEERTRESAESSRFSADIRAAQEAVDEAYRELGRAYYKSPADVPDEAVNAVRDAIARLDQLNAARERRLRCPACGKLLDDDARYCSACGKRLPEAAPDPEPEYEEAEYCASCGAMRHGEEKFCVVCGKSYDGEEIVVQPVATPAIPAVTDTLEEPDENPYAE